VPTYEYACKKCRKHLEIVQSFKDDALTVCPSCGGVLRKVFGNIGIAFKGSGFYKTDSRRKATAGSGHKDGNGSEAAKSDTAKTESAATNSAKSDTPKDQPKSDNTSAKKSKSESTSSAAS
jgi:putative FmdB family regulatory protein